MYAYGWRTKFVLFTLVTYSLLRSMGSAHAGQEATSRLVSGRYDYASERALSFTIVRFPYWEKKQNPRERIGWAPLFSTGQNPESRALVVVEHR